MSHCWVVGFWCGFGISFIILFASAWKKLIEPILVKRLLPRSRPAPLPIDVVNNLLHLDHASIVPPESAIWLNSILSTLYSYLDSPALRSTIYRNLSDVLLDLRRRPTGIFLKETHLETFRLPLPQISQIRRVSSSPLTIAFDFEYKKGGGVTKLETIFGQGWFQAEIKELKGRMFVVITEKAYYVGFGKIDRMIVKGRAIIAGWEANWFNWILNHIYYPFRFRKRYLMPNMYRRWLLDPKE